MLRDRTGAATGIPIERVNSADSGGGSAAAPVSRIRESNPSPAESAFVIPETSTIIALIPGLTVPQSKRARVPVFHHRLVLPGAQTENIVGLSCWNISICVYPGTGFVCSAVKKFGQLPSQGIHIRVAINRHTDVVVPSESSHNLNEICIS